MATVNIPIRIQRRKIVPLLSQRSYQWNYTTHLLYPNQPTHPKNTMELWKTMVGLLSSQVTTTIYYLHDHNDLHMHRRLVPQQLQLQRVDSSSAPIQTSSVRTQRQHLRSHAITQSSDQKIQTIITENKIEK
jgi:hypothetical protein